MHSPARFACPLPQTMQSPPVGPVHVLHSTEHVPHPPPACGKLPSGQTPAPVEDGTHCEVSVEPRTNPSAHCVQVPLAPEAEEAVDAAHAAQFVEHARQSPVESLKNPSAHSEHWTAGVVVVVVAFVDEAEETEVCPAAAARVVHPARHVHEPEAPQTPFSQLQVEGALLACGADRHLPDPVIVSSHTAHPTGQAVHWVPKNPGAQDSQEVPLNPALQTHVPWALHWPDAAQGVAQDTDKMKAESVSVSFSPGKEVSSFKDSLDWRSTKLENPPELPTRPEGI